MHTITKHLDRPSILEKKIDKSVLVRLWLSHCYLSIWW